MLRRSAGPSESSDSGGDSPVKTVSISTATAVSSDLAGSSQGSESVHHHHHRHQHYNGDDDNNNHNETQNVPAETRESKEAREARRSVDLRPSSARSRLSGLSGSFSWKPPQATTAVAPFAGQADARQACQDTDAHVNANQRNGSLLDKRPIDSFNSTLTTTTATSTTTLPANANATKAATAISNIIPSTLFRFTLGDSICGTGKGRGQGQGQGQGQLLDTMEKLGDATGVAKKKPPGLRLRPRNRGPWSATMLTLLTALAGLVLLGLILRSLVTRQLDPKGCRMSYMRPSYARLNDFDTEHTRFASKYTLYLYREQGIDDDTRLRGIPVLFIPGNAGSYKQVRPIAAEAANYFHDVVQHDAAAMKGGARGLDFFTVDFNEDFTAFHGQTMLDQAEYLNEAIRYILSLYLDPRMSTREPELPDPTSVMVLGHSMGGIVARTMLVMPNYQSNSINTIVTMSTPHARPPVSFDSQIVDIYREINDYWRAAYSQQWANNNPLWHVTLVSIAGGGLDTVVPSDYASVESLVPYTHGFTVFTSTMPTVWTSMDHQAILWCDQFRKVVAHALYEVVDVNRPAQTRPRAERMRVFRKHFLTGMEDVVERTAPSREASTLLTLEDSSGAIMAQGERLVLRGLGTGGRTPRAHLMPIPPPGTAAGKRFTLLTDQELDGPGESGGRLEVLFCSVFTLQPGQAGGGQFAVKLDLSGDSGGSTRLACKSAAGDVIRLPASTRSTRNPFTLEGEPEVRPFSYLEYGAEELAAADAQFVAVVDKSSSSSGGGGGHHPSSQQGFVMAEFSDQAQSHRTRHISLRRLLAFGMSVRLPSARPMVTEVRVPSVRSSLLAYNLEVGEQACGGDSPPELFTPLVRQYLTEPHESKFFVNVRRAAISLHGVAPYVPPPLMRRRSSSSGGGDEEGLSFQFWTDPTCDSSIHVKLSIDLLGSMGKLYMRYRTIFAAFPLLVVALVLRKQFQIYNATGVFIPFTEGLDICLRRSIPLMLAGLTIMSLSTGRSSNSSSPSSSSSSSSSLWQWRNATTHTIDFHQNDLLMGTRDPVFWFMVPLAGLICIGACTVLHYSTLALTQLLAVLLGWLSIRPSWAPVITTPPRPLRQQNGSGSGNGTAVGSSNGPNGASGSSRSRSRSSRDDGASSPSRRGSPSAFNPCSPRRRLLTTAILLFLVSTFIPYQFAYLVACLVQLTTAVRALRIVSDYSSSSSSYSPSSSYTSYSSAPSVLHGQGHSHSRNFHSYAHSILLLMLWVLPINLPTLVVWVRNLALHWLTPFSSHHNVASIIPFIVLVEALTTGKMVPRLASSPLRHLTGLMLLGVASCAAVYGVSRAYLLHHLVNAVAAWLVLVHSAAGGESSPWSLAGFGRLFENVGGGPVSCYPEDRKRGKTP